MVALENVIGKDHANTSHFVDLFRSSSTTWLVNHGFAMIKRNAYTSRMKQLDALATITLSGADVKNFLQGQLSNDLNLLNPQRALLACCNSAQGRVQAIPTLIERDDTVIAVLHAAMIDMFTARLRKYVLRSKVTITDTRATLHCYSATHTELSTAQLPAPASLGKHIQHQHASIVRWWDRQAERYLVLYNSARSDDNGDEQWLLDNIRAGLPQIQPQTHEAFVAQMLNLDVLDAISFTKGCYTGQEIIARAHYRGAVKRRMFHLGASCAPPAPGTRILLRENNAHAGDVVIAAAVNGGCELLAVLNQSDHNAMLSLESHPEIPLTLLSLPYDIAKH